MPIYEYNCHDCGERFEVLTAASQRTAARVCPACEGSKVEVLMSAFARPAGSVDEGFSGAPAGGCSCGGSCACGAN